MYNTYDYKINVHTDLLDNLEWQKSRGCWYNCRGGGRNGKQLPLSLCPHNQVHDKIW